MHEENGSSGSGEGLGLDEFLAYNEDGGGGGGDGIWLSKKWRDEGSLIIWLHTRAATRRVWSHSIPIEDEVDDKKNPGHKKLITRFPKFVSPDDMRYVKGENGAWVLQNPKGDKLLEDQYFRDKTTGFMKKPPILDPFLLLREWLRFLIKKGQLNENTIVMSCPNHKDNSRIEWRAGHLAGTMDRNSESFGHTLDAKLEYIFPVVTNANTAGGCLLARESKLLGKKMRECIAAEQESNGKEKGNPLKNPYAFKWTFTKNAKNPNDMYKAARFNAAEYTDDVYYAITSEEFPDSMDLIVVQEGDMEKIRAAFQANQQIKLPLDLIFSESLEERRSVLRGAGWNAGTQGRRTPVNQGQQGGGQATPPARTAPASGNGGPTPPARPGTGGPARPTGNGGPTPPARPGGVTPPAANRSGVTPPTGPKPSTGGPVGRTRRPVEKVPPAPPPPPPEPEVELGPCANCGEQFPVTDTTCPKCGAVYNVETDDEASHDDYSAGGQDDALADSGGGEEVSGEACVCGNKTFREVNTSTGVVKKCTRCGQEQGDDVPFN